MIDINNSSKVPKANLLDRVLKTLWHSSQSACRVVVFASLIWSLQSSLVQGQQLEANSNNRFDTTHSFTARAGQTPSQQSSTALNWQQPAARYVAQREASPSESEQGALLRSLPASQLNQQPIGSGLLPVPEPENQSAYQRFSGQGAPYQEPSGSYSQGILPAQEPTPLESFRSSPLYEEGIVPLGPDFQSNEMLGENWFEEPVDEWVETTAPREMFPTSGLKDRRFPFLPPLTLETDLIPKVDLLGMESYKASSSVPLIFIPGSPPPILSGGYEYRHIDAPISFELPSSLYTATLGISVVNKLTNGWYTRLSLDGAFASDLKNRSSDAWQIRGSGFVLIPYQDRWIFMLGGVATGRRDFPVIPAIGALWTPRFDRRVELMFPRPRVSMLLRESKCRQDWLYVGAAFGGGTWAYERANNTDDLLTYREWRIMLGWENIAPVLPGQFTSFGRKYSLEVGYVFGRKFEFERGRTDLELGDTAVLRALIRF